MPTCDLKSSEIKGDNRKDCGRNFVMLVTASDRVTCCFDSIHGRTTPDEK